MIVSTESERQSEAILNEILKQSKKEKLGLHHLEKDEHFGWVFLDYFDVAVHIFSEEKRHFYDLEHLWKEARRMRLR